MPACTADATWYGSLMNGEGTVALGSGLWDGPYGTPDAADASNPEELLAAGHASCFAMTVAYTLTEAGYSPEHVDTEAMVHLEQNEDGFSIESIEVLVEGEVPDATAEEFHAVVSAAEQHCPVSKALGGTEIDVTASMMT